MRSDAARIETYLDSLPTDRRDALETLRAVFRANLDPVFEEGMQYGMIGYYVPLAVYPDGYHCDPRQPLPFAGLASQKNHIGVYLFCLYTDPEEQARFEEAWKKTGKKLDMGKSCIRFKRIEDAALDVLGRTIKRMTAKKFIAVYEASLGAHRRRTASKTPAAPARKKASKSAVAKTPRTKATARKKAGKP
ncbi:MAG: DUF1801 domain-containing protein [Planctomycetota bacterium]